MGQYYRIFMCDEDGSHPYVVSSYEIDDNGAKLLEHSYYTNRFVEVALARLCTGCRRIWWMGDYAEEDDIPEDLRKYGSMTAWDDRIKTTVFNDGFDNDAKLYLANHDTHEYIDLLRVRELNKVPGWTASIHPLPILTAVGNGRGGGDYHSGSNMNMVGLWAGQRLEILQEIPEDNFFVWVDVSDDARFVEG